MSPLLKEQCGQFHNGDDLFDGSVRVAPDVLGAESTILA